MRYPQGYVTVSSEPTRKVEPCALLPPAPLAARQPGPAAATTSSRRSRASRRTSVAKATAAQTRPRARRRRPSSGASSPANTRRPSQPPRHATQRPSLTSRSYSAFVHFYDGWALGRGRCTGCHDREPSLTRFTRCTTTLSSRRACPNSRRRAWRHLPPQRRPPTSAERPLPPFAPLPPPYARPRAFLRRCGSHRPRAP